MEYPQWAPTQDQLREAFDLGQICSCCGNIVPNVGHVTCSQCGKLICARCFKKINQDPPLCVDCGGLIKEGYLRTLAQIAEKAICDATLGKAKINVGQQESEWRDNALHGGAIFLTLTWKRQKDLQYREWYDATKRATEKICVALVDARNWNCQPPRHVAGGNTHHQLTTDAVAYRLVIT